MNYKSTSTNYAILPEWVKAQLEKKIISILKSMQIVSLNKDLQNLLRILFHKNIISLQEKNHSGNHLSA